MAEKSLTTLLAGIVDYAGLFPPASLSMRETVCNYAAYLNSPESWMLGRLVVPVARLAEFAAEAEFLLPNNASPWRVSALGGASLQDDVQTISEFSKQTVGVLVDTLEIKVNRIGEILTTASLIPKSLEVYVEAPIEPDPLSYVQVIRDVGFRAKVRTGGITADAFPSSAALARFIGACIEANVEFKATAGLHHPLRATYSLTYNSDSPKGKMYGFLNVFLASAFMRNGLAETEATQLLEEESRDAIHFDGEGVQWRSHRLAVQRLQAARSGLSRSFGSCSFREPVEDLKSMKLL